MTPAELFDRAGRALYGDHYVAPLAHALGVGKVTVAKWRAGESTIPAGIWRELCPMLSARHGETIAIMRAVADAGLTGDKEKSPPAG